MFTKDNKKKLVPLRRFSNKSLYSSAYLSVLVQRKKLKAEKIGRNYFTTIEWFEEYLEKYARDEKREEANKIKNKKENNFLGVQKIKKNKETNQEKQENIFLNLLSCCRKQISNVLILIFFLVLFFIVLEHNPFSNKKTIKALKEEAVFIVSYWTNFYKNNLQKNNNEFLVNKKFFTQNKINKKRNPRVAGVSENIKGESAQNNFLFKDNFSVPYLKNLMFFLANKLKHNLFLVKRVYIKFSKDFFRLVYPVKTQESLSRVYSLENNSPKEGLVVVPFENDKEANEIKNKIEKMFSDEVIFETKGDKVGIIKPVFGSKEKSQKYFYMMVPVYEE